MRRHSSLILVRPLGAVPLVAHERLTAFLDHCVELLRQAVMCQPDETYMTFEWRDGKPKPSMKIEGPPRMCVDWETWERKFASQIVPGEEMATLVNPNL